jgi:hypothetical protein
MSDDKKIQGTCKIINLHAGPGLTGTGPLEQLRKKDTYTCPGDDCNKLSVIVLSASVADALIVVVRGSTAAL